jgi:hypothetical protein
VGVPPQNDVNSGNVFGEVFFILEIRFPLPLEADVGEGDDEPAIFFAQGFHHSPGRVDRPEKFQSRHVLGISRIM